MSALSPSARPSTGRRAIAPLLVLALVSFGVSNAAFADDRPANIHYSKPGLIPPLDAETLAKPIKRVLITNQGLHPSRVTLEPGERIVWQSYAGAATAIVFEREVAASMVCHSLVNFFLYEDELRSGEIHTGERASFCELKPGQYRYRAVRANPRSGASAGAARRIDGWIVVKGATPAPEAPARLGDSLASSLLGAADQRQASNAAARN